MRKSGMSSHPSFQPLFQPTRVRHSMAKKKTQKRRVGDTLRAGCGRFSLRIRRAGMASGWWVSLTQSVSNCCIMAMGENMYS